MTGLLSIAKTKDTTDVVLYHPQTGDVLLNADGSQMTITIHGPYSERYKKVTHEQQNRRLLKAQRSGGRMNLTAEELEASALEVLVECTETWNLTLTDKLEKFDKAKVREVYTTLPWVKNQVDDAFADTRAFLG